MKQLIAIVILLTGISFTRIYADTAEFYDLVVESAQEAIGWNDVPNVDDEYFSDDCIGFVRYCYYQAGIDLTELYAQSSRGVDSLYYGLQYYGLTFTNVMPEPGDIIFFNNTYDVDDDGVWDDPLSHVGVVEEVGKHNTIAYIHYSGSGVARDYINLDYPYTYAMREEDGELYEINTFLRRDNDEGYPKYAYISSFFFQGYAHIPIKAMSE